MLFMVPSFPDGCQLDNDLDMVCRVVCEGYQSGENRPDFGLFSGGYPGDGSQLLELSQSHVVGAKSEDPHLAALVIGGGSSIQSECPAAVLLERDDLHACPAAMSLEWVLLSSCFLWFKRYPPMGPQPFFIMTGNAVHPLGWHGFMVLRFVPLA